VWRRPGQHRCLFTGNIRTGVPHTEQMQMANAFCRYLEMAEMMKDRQSGVI
jgi:hypothetical protein